MSQRAVSDCSGNVKLVSNIQSALKYTPSAFNHPRKSPQQSSGLESLSNNSPFGPIDIILYWYRFLLHWTNSLTLTSSALSIKYSYFFVELVIDLYSVHVWIPVFPHNNYLFSSLFSISVLNYFNSTTNGKIIYLIWSTIAITRPPLMQFVSTGMPVATILRDVIFCFIKVLGMCFEANMSTNWCLIEKRQYFFLVFLAPTYDCS